MLTLTQQRKLLELDANMGGLLEAAAKAKVSQNRKALIIGLGGMGGKVVARIKTELKKRVDYNETKIGLLAIDSDSGDLKLLEDNKDEVGLAPGTETFQIYFEGADDILHDENKRPEFFKKWLNKGFSQKLRGAGAGAIRQAGRALLLGNNYDRLTQRISAAITSLCGAGILGQLDVYIVAGIAGGTGSGSFIDMPNIVRQVFSSQGGMRRNLSLNAYLLLPSVMMNIPGFKENDRRCCKLNGYAALKELDYYMGKSYRVGSDLYDEKFQYPQGNPVALENLERLYDTCILFSGTVGGNIAGDINNYAIDVTAETIINMLVEMKQENAVRDGIAETDFQLSKSFLDNCDIRRRNLEDTPPMDGAVFAPDSYYMYCAAGVGTATIPNDAIMAYVGATVFEKLEVEKFHKGHTADSDMIRTFVAKALMSPQQMMSSGIEADTAYQASVNDGDKPDFEMIAQNNLNNFERAIEKSKMALSDRRRTLVDNAINRATALFMSTAKQTLLDRGPYELLTIMKKFRRDDETASESVRGVKQVIGGYMDEIIRIINDREQERTANAARLQDAKEKVVKAGLIKVAVFPQFKQKLTNNYVEYALQDATLDLKIKAAQLLKDSLKRYTDKILDFLANCEKFVDVLDEIEKILGGGRDRFLNAGGAVAVSHRYCMNMLDPSDLNDMYGWAKDRLDTIIAKVNLAEIQHDIIEDFSSHPDRWVGGDKEFEAHNRIREIFDRSFGTEAAKDGNCAKITIEDYFQRVNDLDGMDAVNREIRRIADRIKSYADPMFSAVPGFPASATHISKSYILVPGHLSAEIKREFVNYATEMGVEIAFTSTSGQITWYNIIAALPLYADYFMREYETVYLNSSTACQHINERLSDEELTWNNYPPVISNAIWRPMGYRNSKEEEFLASRFNPVLDKARECGLLSYNGADGAETSFSVNILQQNVQFAENAANKYCLDFIGADTAAPVGKALYAYLTDQTSAESRMSLPVSLQKPSLDNGAAAEEEAYAKARMILRKNVPLFLLLKKALKVYEAAEKVVKRFNETILFRTAVEGYLKALSVGQIRQEGKTWGVVNGNEVIPLINVDQQRFLGGREQRLVQKDMLGYAIFLKYMQLPDKTRDTVAVVVKAAISSVKFDPEASAGKLKPFIVSALEFMQGFDGDAKEPERSQLARLIGVDSIDQAMKFYTVCIDYGNRLNIMETPE